MTDKVQKIREEVEKRYEYWKEKESNSHSIESEIRMSECQHLLLMLNSLQEEHVSDDFEMALTEMIDKAQKCVVEPIVVAQQWKDELIKLAKSEEPVSEDLEEASKEWLRPQLDISYAAYGETKQMELTHFDGYAMLDAIEFGAKWKKEHLWKPADGDDIPEIDREVIALLDNGKIVFAHRPNPNGWDGKSLTSCKVEHYTPKTYDKGGWNILNVKYWLDVELPKETEL